MANSGVSILSRRSVSAMRTKDAELDNSILDGLAGASGVSKAIHLCRGNAPAMRLCLGGICDDHDPCGAGCETAT